MVRSGGDYPLLSGGDINLYSLFVERSMSLIKPDGFVGLLTPSGIYADKTAARFFESVSTSRRVGGLFDFENKKISSRTVVSLAANPRSQELVVVNRGVRRALILGGEERRFDQTECAFFLHDTKTVHDEDRCFPLTPDDFVDARVKVRIHGWTAARKLHLPKLTGEIVAQTLTPNHATHLRCSIQVEPLLTHQIETPIAAVGGDGAYDRRKVFEALAASDRAPPIAIIPPKTPRSACGRR